MTVSVGLCVGPHTILGADQQVTDAEGTIYLVEDKVFVGNGVGYGFAGSWAAYCKLARLGYPEARESKYKPQGQLRRWCEETLMTRTQMLTDGLSEGEDGESGDRDFSLLVGYQGELVVFGSRTHCIEDSRRFSAIGTGARMALAVLRAYMPHDDIPLDVHEGMDIVRRAIEISSEFDCYCSGEPRIILC